MKNVLQNKIKMKKAGVRLQNKIKMKKTGVRSIILLLIIGLSLLICLTGAATAATEINTMVQSGTYTRGFSWRKGEI